MCRKQRGDLTACVPCVSLYLDIELLSQASCLTLYTSSNWSSEEDLSLSSETEISFQGQVVGGKGHGSSVSSHLPLMYPQPTPWGPKRFLFCWWVKPAWAIEIHRISIGHVCCCVGQQSYYLATSINIYTTWTQRVAADVANAGRPKFVQRIKVHPAKTQGNSSWDRLFQETLTLHGHKDSSGGIISLY